MIKTINVLIFVAMSAHFCRFQNKTPATSAQSRTIQFVNKLGPETILFLSQKWHCTDKEGGQMTSMREKEMFIEHWSWLFLLLYNPLKNVYKDGCILFFLFS